MIDRPHFIIGGAPRSGTTYLAQALASHPDICMAQPFIPEPKVLMLPEQTEGEYVARYQQLFASALPQQQCGEKTSYYLESAAARDRIKALLPTVKMLFIVREPVARAYSNYLWSKKNGLETWSFAEAIAAEGTRPNPLPSDKAYARPFDYLSRGDYAAFAEPYFAALGRHRIKFVLYEDLHTNHDRLMRSIHEFLDVRVLPVTALGVVNSAKEMGPPIETRIAAQLREQMRPRVQRFAALTGLDVNCWGYDG